MAIMPENKKKSKEKVSKSKIQAVKIEPEE